MTLSVSLSHHLGAFRVEATFETAGRLTALFGRSGAGKTTIVNAIAGLIRPDRARIAVDGAEFVDTERGVFVPAHRRRVGYVFQEGRLFPHLTVRQNLLYGRWFSGGRRDPADLDAVVAMLGLGHLLRRRPFDLSGGEKQRTAIGRALLARPRLLLMDEPLASLDEERKADILPYIERLRDEVRIPVVYVSHAVAEVARLATDVVVMAEGRVQRVGAVADVLARPGTLPGAGGDDLGGVIAARVVAHDAADDLTMLESRAGMLAVPRLGAAVGSEVRVHVRARDVMLATERPSGLSALNVLPGTVVEVGTGDGPVVAVAVDLGGERLLARITRRSCARLGLAPGRPVFAVLKSIAVGRGDVGFVGEDRR
jgi:molybdate transport system ATP-binding protein